jgi:hypothetical protein
MHGKWLQGEKFLKELYNVTYRDMHILSYLGGTHGITKIFIPLLN